MKTKPAWVVLGSYSEAESADKIYRELSGRACLIDSEAVAGRGDQELIAEFAPLRLEGESLLALRATPDQVEAAVLKLRSFGSPAIFTIREDATWTAAPQLVTEPLTGERLCEYAAGLASAHGQPGKDGPNPQLLSRLRDSERAIASARAGLISATRLDHALTAAAEWLLDNFYLVRTHGAEVRNHLPRHYARILPTLPSLHGQLRVAVLAAELVKQTDLTLDEASIIGWLRGYQKVEPLTIAELWAFPLLLRLALIEVLAQLASRIGEAQQLREAGYLWANRLASGARQGTKVFSKMVRELESQPISLRPQFVACLTEQLQGDENALVPAQRWLEDRLEMRLIDLVSTEHIQEAAERVSIANAFRSLRTLSQIDFTCIFEEVSLVEEELRKDPADTYSHCDFATRDQCRRAVELISRRSHLGQVEISRKSVELAASADEPRFRHVVYYLLGDGAGRLESVTHVRLPVQQKFLRAVKRNATAAYLGGILSLTAGFVTIAAALEWEGGQTHPAITVLLAFLAGSALSELAVQIANVLVISLLPPDQLPRMDFKSGIPEEHAALVVVPMMLSSVDVVRREIEKLEIRFLANQHDNLWFSLFSDFTDFESAVAPGDAAVLQVALDGIDDLNARYPGNRFLLFHRPRSWSESEQRWIGFERKRGKLEELSAHLCGEAPFDILRKGGLPKPVAYVITLDADTQLPAGTARRMVETIAHPLNKVEIDPKTRVRTRGYTIIQPRVSITLPSATASGFTRVFSDTTGTDPYSQAVSDAQQDLFRDAIFHGKAIYDVQAFHTILGHRFPPETLLSHDLIEGAHVGVAFASDIEIFETLPADYASFSHRQHRWIRGDWQIAQWALARVPAVDGQGAPNPLTVINRWRIFDNLRRSLVPAAAMALLLLAWTLSHSPAVWSVLFALSVVLPALAPLLDRVAERMEGSIQAWRGALDELARVVVTTALLPHQAWVALDAIGRVWYRRFISHRKMLEWQTAEMVSQLGDHHVSDTLRQLLAASGLSIILLAALRHQPSFAAASPFIVLWIAAPALIAWLDRPEPGPNRPSVTAEEDIAFLRGFARRTWRFFEDLAGPASHWLPPDNSQVALRVEVAQRTSPTNIGLGLVSALGAFDLGYATVDSFESRCSQTLATVERLERYEGHLLNWYDTQTLQPLLPRYVSTVDSGNLLASLWVLEQGCAGIPDAFVLGPLCLTGLTDTLLALEQVCENDPSVAVPLKELKRLFRGSVEGHELIGRLRLALVPAQQLADARGWQTIEADERSYWATALIRELRAWTEVVDRYLPWMETLSYPPDAILRGMGESAVKLRRRALSSVPTLTALSQGLSMPVSAILTLRRNAGLQPQVSEWLDQVAADYQSAQTNAQQAIEKLRTIAATAGRIASGIDMRFLYDPHMRLFGIGYAVGGPVQFTNHYDLLASECRLASLVAIAKGDVPMEHWFALARPRGTTVAGQTLLSWSGTMFEYLMPLLFTRSYANSLLDDACRQAVTVQIEYGRTKRIPWGLSECAYSALDSHQIYQYQAFGVPGLGLKPDLEDDLVVAPYATMLALAVDPPAALQNLRRMKELGLTGPMGFYESIDYTRKSKPAGDPGVVVYTYMSHHQGMGLLALINALSGGIMQRRFHADRRVRAIESILFERIPLARPSRLRADPIQIPVRIAIEEEAAGMSFQEDTPMPRAHLQGNGRYALMVTNAGGGYSRFDGIDLTRWRSDTTMDCWGSFLYIRDLRTTTVWSATYQPVGGKLGTSTVRFASDHAEYQRRVLGIETVTEVTVAAEDDAELRRVTVTNRTLRNRQIELTSYCELALAAHDADRAHPAFAKIFVETECLDGRVLIAHRRLRSPEEPEIWCAHLLTGAAGPIQYETDRELFLGRGNGASSPDALRRDLTGTTGTVLDPVFSLRCRLSMDAREQHELTFVTLAAHSRESLMALVDKYSRPESVSRAFEMAWTRAQLEFRYLGIGAAAAHRFQELSSHLLYPNARLRPPEDRLHRNQLGQQNLWAHGISGDLPIMTALVGEERNLPLVRELLLAHTYWRARGFQADLVIANQEEPSYDRPLRQQLERLIEAHSLQTGKERPGGVFLRDWLSLPERDRDLIVAASSAVLYGGRGSLQQQLAAATEFPVAPVLLPVSIQTEEPSRPLPFLDLPYFNGLGGFTPDGREYAIYLKPGSVTPAPWSNVIAGPRFGTLVTESGLGFTWAGNSQANRLTPWSNDAVSDPQGEAIYLRDEETGTVWTPTAAPIREKDAYRAKHGHGYTVYEHNSHSISQELTVFVPALADDGFDPVKVCRLRLTNHSSRRRRLSATYFASWVLGTDREIQQLHIQTEWDAPSDSLLARSHWSGHAAGDTAFLSSSPAAASHSGDRSQFLGRNGSMAAPAALAQTQLDNRAGAALDGAGVLQVLVSIDPGRDAEVTFLLGQVGTAAEVRTLVDRYRTPGQVQRALDGTRQSWENRLSAIQVKTPVLAVDFMLNGWLVYQSLSCRFWGRSAFYQSGGAFGYRDQLQDCLALLYSRPELARSQILRSASRQFPQGDVQHWWHPDTGVGVRTRCSDDMVWLAYATAQYVAVTGDAGILEVEAPFLDGAVLEPAELERVFVPAITQATAPLWKHCALALDHAAGVGSHGLPLFGSGDWNDGMNLVGAEGQGESTWLAWFLCTVYRMFLPLLDARDPQHAALLRDRATQIASAMEASGWDGNWYLRGFFDNGQPLGSHANAEAQIDSLPQSWAVISGAADVKRARQALESTQRLVLEKEKLVLLFTPPFNHSEPHPGYIMGYPPGIRENGGQYTHGSLWLAMAWARARNGDRAVKLLQLMNPVEHSRNPEDAVLYHGEPYVVAADIFSAPGHVGRSGWTWYTGSAGWMYRVWIEEVLGLRVRGDKLTIDPVIPEAWPGFEMTYRHRSATYEIKVTRDPLASSMRMEEDGQAVSQAWIQVVDDQRVHRVSVVLPKPAR